jgi:CheY-like chemotaxis protein
MPDVSGQEVLRALKADAATAAIPVIISTSKHLEAQEREALLAHAMAVLNKQAGAYDEVLALLQEALNRARMMAVNE